MACQPALISPEVREKLEVERQKISKNSKILMILVDLDVSVSKYAG